MITLKTGALGTGMTLSLGDSPSVKAPECRTCSACGGEYWVHFGLVTGKEWFKPHACVGGVIVGVPKARRSNLDLNGRLVKKGALVSWHGYRFYVSKVRMGTCYPVFSPVERRFFDCESVQVVS